MKTLTAIAIASAILATSCGSSDGRYAAFEPIGYDGWDYGHALHMAPGTPDSLPCLCDLVLTVRHTTDYRYSNLWLEISIGSSAVDTVEITLADNFGRWLGRQSGLSVTKADTVARGVTFGPGDTVTVRHIMRPDLIDHIERVGIVLLPQTQAKP